jgi:hypothetical protein
MDLIINVGEQFVQEL